MLAAIPLNKDGLRFPSEHVYSLHSQTRTSTQVKKIPSRLRRDGIYDFKKPVLII